MKTQSGVSLRAQHKSILDDTPLPISPFPPAPPICQEKIFEQTCIRAMSKEKEGDPHIYFLFYSSFLNRLPINYKKKSCNRAGPRYTHVKQLKNNQLHLHKNRTNCARIAYKLYFFSKNGKRYAIELKSTEKCRNSTTISP